MTIRSKLDDVPTPNLSKIKEIFKRIYFTDIETEEHIQENKGNLYYKKLQDSKSKIIGNAPISYTIHPKKVGLSYGTITTTTDKDGIKKTTYRPEYARGYAIFIADLVSQKVIYSDELNHFIKVEGNSYSLIDEIKFLELYPTDKKYVISDFLEVMEHLYDEHMPTPSHEYVINPYKMAGIDWIYDFEKLELIQHIPTSNELYFAQHEVKGEDIDYTNPRTLLNMISDNKASHHNIRLMHAYIMHRKLKLVPAEQYFILKDFGRSGKGLITETLKTLFKYKQVNFDALQKSGSFEATNEWANFYGAEVAHANETGEVNQENMRILRKIATSEIVTGRKIGQNAFSFKNEAVLILDTNSMVDIGEIKANTSRTVKIALKDRPPNETNEERHKVFKPYWEYILPKGEPSISASVSFLLYSCEYLKEQQNKFVFHDVTLKNYASADNLTETQRILIEVILQNGFIISSDETLQKAIANDYGSMRYKKAKDDVRAIGVGLNKPKKIEGQVFKVNFVENSGLFEEAVKLLEVEKNENEGLP